MLASWLAARGGSLSSTWSKQLSSRNCPQTVCVSLIADNDSAVCVVLGRGNTFVFTKVQIIGQKKTKGSYKMFGEDGVVALVGLSHICFMTRVTTPAAFQICLTTNCSCSHKETCTLQRIVGRPDAAGHPAPHGHRIRLLHVSCTLNNVNFQKNDHHSTTLAPFFFFYFILNVMQHLLLWCFLPTISVSILSVN